MRAAILFSLCTVIKKRDASIVILAIILEATPETHDEDGVVHALCVFLDLSLVLEFHFHTESCCFEDYRWDGGSTRMLSMIVMEICSTQKLMRL